MGASAAAAAVALLAVCAGCAGQAGGSDDDPASDLPARAAADPGTAATTAPPPAPAPAPAPASSGCSPTKPFTSVAALPSGGNKEGGARYDATKSTMVFTRGVSSPAPAIGTSLVDGTTTPFAGIADALGIGYPSIDPTGTVLYYVGITQDNNGVYSDVFTATRASKTAAFSGATMLAAAGRSGSDYAPYLVSTGKTLYWAHYDPTDGGLYIKQWPLTTAGSLTIAMADPTAMIGNPVVSADEKTIYYWAYRSTSKDLFVATRGSTAEAFGAGVQLTGVGDTAADEQPTWISDDQCELLYEKLTYTSSGAPSSIAMMLATR